MVEKGRLRRIFANSSEEPDVVLIANGDHPDPNFFYISGYTTGLFERNMLFLFPDSRIEVLTNPLEEQAARQNADYKIHVERNWSPSERKKFVSSLLRGCKRVGVNFGGVTHKDFQAVSALLKGKEIVDVSDPLLESRLVKDADELQAISNACRIISDVVDEVPELVEEGMTEKELKAQIDHDIIEKGADSPSFGSIVAFGESSALPHHTPGERRLLTGDNVLIDVGARFHLYCSDITRTFFFGRASDRQRRVYAKVLEAQTKAKDAIHEGVEGRDVHSIASSVIERSEFKGRFTHGLGHSLGLEVHDGPGLSRASSTELKKNMVMTVEPGIYLPGEGGVRIEDDVIVTKDACRVLTHASSDLIEI
jgi:Xaa-Pro dipeptidase